MIQKGIHTEDFLCNGLTIASLQLLKRSLVSDILLYKHRHFSACDPAGMDTRILQLIGRNR